MAPFVEHFKSYFEKFFLMNFISTSSNLLKRFSFDDFLMIKDHVQSAPRKDQLI